MQETSFPVEILVHDDCSTDGTADIIREYEAEHSDLIRGIYQDHNRYQEGVLVWKDFLYSKARGKYVAVTDADDFWTDPLKLEKQVAALEADDTLMACVTSCAVVEESGRSLGRIMQVLPGNRGGRYGLREFLLEGHNWPVATVVYRQRNVDAVFDRAALMENQIMADWTMWVSLLLEGDYCFLEDVTASYRINPSSQTHTNVDERRMGQARLNFTLLPLVASLLPEGYEDVRFKLLNDNASWWWNLANAHKHSRHYLRMSGCLAVAAWRKLRYKLLG